MTTVTSTNTERATTFSLSLIVRVCNGGVRNQLVRANAPNEATRPARRPASAATPITTQRSTSSADPSEM